MALVKCPDCGKMVSSRVSNCPDCGCPAEYFEETTISNSIANNDLKKNNDDAITNKNSSKNDEKYMVEFYLFDDIALSYDIRDKELMKFCGSLAQIANDSSEEFLELYKKLGTMDKVVKTLGDKAGEILNGIMDSCVRFLFMQNINFTPLNFFDKYENRTKLVYTDYIDGVLEAYADIYGEKKQLEQFRVAEKASRSRWQGGGFGLKGALKGAMTASALNLGADVFHSFGDGLKKKIDESTIENKLNELYFDKNTVNTMVLSIGYCVENYICCVLNEMEINGKIHTPNLKISNSEAMAIYNNLSYQKNQFIGATFTNEKYKKFYMKKIIECISVFPFRKLYYRDGLFEFIKADSYIREKGGYGLGAFLKFWNMEFLIDNYEKQYDEKVKQIEKTKESRLNIYEKKKTVENYYNIKKILIDNETTNNVLERGLSDFTDKQYSDTDKINAWFSEFSKTSFPEYKKYPILTWIPEKIDREEFFKYLRNDRVGADPLNYLWIIGDTDTYKKYKRPPQSLYSKVRSKLGDNNIMLYSDDSKNMGLVGMILTDNYVVNLYKFQAIHISDIRDIYCNDHDLYVVGGQSQFRIYIKGFVLENITSSMKEKIYNQYFVNLLKLYVYRYSNNSFVYDKAMEPLDK